MPTIRPTQIGPTTTKPRTVTPRTVEPKTVFPTTVGGEQTDITIARPDSAPEAAPTSRRSLRGTSTVSLDGESLTWTGKGLAGLYGAVEVLAKGQSALWERVKCDPETGGALAVPEWWAVRPGANIPQLCVVLREIDQTGKVLRSQWSFSIPHYVGVEEEAPNLPPFTKGSYFGTLTLVDNTKLTINAASMEEAEDFIQACVPYIDPAFIGGQDIHLGLRKGKSLKVTKVKPYRAQFYSTGQKDTVPDWEVDFP